MLPSLGHPICLSTDGMRASVPTEKCARSHEHNLHAAQAAHGIGPMIQSSSGFYDDAQQVQRDTYHVAPWSS